MTWWSSRQPSQSVEQLRLDAQQAKWTIERQEKLIQQMQQQQQSQNQWSQWSAGKGCSKGGNPGTGGSGKSAGKGANMACSPCGDGAQYGGASTSGGLKWHCNWADCAKSAAGAMNNAGRTSCFACGRDKNRAIHPPPALAVKTQAAVPARKKNRKSRNKDKEEPAPVPNGGGEPKSPADKAATKTAKQERKRLRRSQKRKEQEAVEVQEIDSEEEEMEDKVVPLAKDELAFLTNLGVTPTTSRLNVDRLFGFPKPLAATDDPEKEVTAASGRTSTKSLEEAQSNVELYQKMLDENKAVPGRAHLATVLEQNLKEWKTKVEGLTESQAGGKAVVSSLNAMRTAEEAKEDNRIVSCEGKALVAKQRYERLKTVLVGEQNKIQEKLIALEAQYIKVQDEWKKDAETRANYYQRKMAAWDTRLAAVKPAGGGDDGLAEVAQEIAAAATPAVAAVPPASPTPQADYYLTTRWTIAELPPGGKPNKAEDIEGMAILHHNLTYWTQCGMFPMSFAQMFHGCVDTDPILVSKALAGEAVWKKMYTDRKLTAENIVPVQMVNILQTSLGKIEDELKADKKRTKIIQEKFDAFYQQDQEDKVASKGAYGQVLW